MGLVDKGRMPAPLTKLLNMSRSYSLWVYQWGLACCAIEMAYFGSGICSHRRRTAGAILSVTVPDTQTKSA